MAIPEGARERAAGSRVHPVAAGPSSPRSCVQLPGVEISEKLNLRLELDAEALSHSPAALCHQGDHRGGRRLPRVLDEVRVLVGEAGTTELEAAAAGRIEQNARAAPLRA